MKCALVSSIAVAAACSKPLALAPAPESPPYAEPTDPEPRNSRDFHQQRDPRGGYTTHPAPPNDRSPADPPPHDRVRTDPDPPPPPPACGPREVEVERCITGGMARPGPNGPEAIRSCSTRCESEVPTGGRSTKCGQQGPRRYLCESFAP